MAEQSTGGAVAQGAATGAATGAIAGPWGAVIGGVIGAIGGFLQAGSANSASRRQASLNRRAQRMIRPQRIMNVANQVQPQFRALVARGIGPGIEGKMDAGLARSGWDETGVGAVLKNMSMQMPGVVASNAALEWARQVQFARSQSLLGAPGVPPQQNSILAGVAGGLQGGLGTWLYMQNQKKPAPGVDQPLAPSPQPVIPSPQVGAQWGQAFRKGGFQPTWDDYRDIARSVPAVI